MRKALILAVLLTALPVLAQSMTGELRLTVTDPTGVGMKSTVELVSQGNEFHHTFTTNDQGNLNARRLPYGIYQVQIRVQGFAEISEPIEIRSAFPLTRTIRLQLGLVSESVKVSASGTLVDPYRAGSVNEIGPETIQTRLTALPGRSMQELVNSEPGWLYEGNAVHPASPSRCKLTGMTPPDLLSLIDAEISRLEQARALIAAVAKSQYTTAATDKTRKKKRTLSPEARRRIAEAQRKRWAKQNKAAK
jgi:hypothetical protein